MKNENSYCAIKFLEIFAYKKFLNLINNTLDNLDFYMLYGIIKYHLSIHKFLIKLQGVGINSGRNKKSQSKPLEKKTFHHSQVNLHNIHT